MMHGRQNIQGKSVQGNGLCLLWNKALSEVLNKVLNTLCWHSAELLNVNAGGTYINHCTLKEFKF